MDLRLLPLLLLLSCCSPQADLQPSNDLQTAVKRIVVAWAEPRGLLLTVPKGITVEEWAGSWPLQSLREAIRSSEFYQGQDVDTLILEALDASTSQQWRRLERRTFCWSVATTSRRAA